MIKILIVDDHAIVRQGLIQILTEESDMTVVGEAQNAQDFFSLVRNRPWDIAILDVSLPGRSGLDILKELKHEYPMRPVLMLSAHSEDQYAIRTLKAGAAGYLSKDSAPTELIQAVRKVLQDGKYISPTLAEKIAFDITAESNRPLHETLSDREFQVLCQLASGKTVGELAEEMSLSVKTISTYRTRILQKMKMNNNSDLTQYAMQHGLV
ncbi:MAG: response regulator transcription factor [Acidobacteria bacterium]|nr:response regulator transcription factor [Acidobacteriota bacterium]